MALKFDDIVVDLVKLRDYCLSDEHPRGRHKARVFRSALGLQRDGAGELREALLNAARQGSGNLKMTQSDDFGDRYVLDFAMTTAVGSATVRST
ncbi:MAG: DUF6883 domain-containing protein [Alphaproteobacteria bacterium]